MNPIIDSIYGYITLYGMKVLQGILFFIIGKWIAKLVAEIVEKILVRAKTDTTLTKFSKNVIYITLMIFVVVAVLGILGIQTASFIAVVGSASLAIGLALQGSLSNFAAGVMVILFQTFKVGDIIEAASVTGKVEEIQIFSTILLTPDNKRIIVPNSKITADKITIFP